MKTSPKTTIDVLFRCKACDGESAIEVAAGDEAVGMQARFSPCPHCGERELRIMDAWRVQSVPIPQDA